ncbi:MAG TPA: hypothetical protein VK638_32410 [Edaphobacter sp.]|nr:hypothetical protein [Edaphobacter sp.]
MATRRKPPKNVGELDFSKRLADALGQQAEPEKPQTGRMPVVGDRVMVGTSDTVWTVLSISHSGKEVNLHIPDTTLQRFRVMISDLRFLDGPFAPKPREPEKPKIDVEEVREHIASVHHSIMEHLNGEIAVLKKYLKSKRIPFSASDALDGFSETTEVGWKKAVEAIEAALGDE